MRFIAPTSTHTAFNWRVRTLASDLVSACLCAATTSAASYLLFRDCFINPLERRRPKAPFVLFRGGAGQ